MKLLFLAAWAAILLEGRDGVPQNLHRAFALASYGVRHGCLHCVGVLARCFLGGFGCKESITVAEYLAQKSAAAGSRYGYFVLGYLAYDRGHHDLAQKHWQKAADLGLAVAQVNLAKLFIDQSRLMERSMANERSNPSERAFLQLIVLKKKALNLFVEACQKGHPSAWGEIGRMCNEFGDFAPGCSMWSFLTQRN